MDAVEIMRNTKSFAIIGASAKEGSYGFKLVKLLADEGYIVYPINPKYSEIYGLKTFKSAVDTPDIPENIVLAMSALNNIKVLEAIKNYKTSFVWLPPECWDDELITKAVEFDLNILKNKCPIGAFLKLKYLSKNKETE